MADVECCAAGAVAMEYSTMRCTEQSTVQCCKAPKIPGKWSNCQQGGAVIPLCNDCSNTQTQMSLCQIVLAQKHHCSQNAVLASQLHCPENDNIVI